MLIVAMPVIFVLSEQPGIEFGLWARLGTWIWLLGFLLEAGGDWQLQRFKASPANKGKLLTTGFWSLTRHPNYFGDTLQWWGFGLFALGSTQTVAWITLLGPLVMTLFIIKVSGVALLEKSLTITKPGYANYAATTPPFFPKWPFWMVLTLGVVALTLAETFQS
jgi:steroid 5-alpha reductase family enzyme